MKKVNWIPNKAKSWHKLPSPARPWPSEVKWFEKYALKMKKKEKRDVLILGSTVEFRSMLHKNKMNVHVVDFSKDFYDILTKTQRKRLRYTGKETFYHQDWLKMKLGKKFDLIFGDWTPGVLHTKEYNTFFKRTIAHLKDDGLLIIRNCQRPTRKLVNMDEVVKRHYKKYARKYSFYESSMQYMYVYRTDPKTHAGLLEESYKGIEDVYQKGLLKKKDYDFAMDALSLESGTLSSMVKSDFEKIVKKHFKILAEHHVKEPSSDWYPIYVLKKK